MEERMFNTFYRITKNKAVTNILTFISYRVLLIYYYVARLFLKKRLNVSREEAFEKVNKISKKPMKKYSYNKRFTKCCKVY